MSIRWIFCGLVVFVGSCASPPKGQEDRQQDRAKIQAAVGQEMSLKEDRTALNELRKEIPEQKKKENDELALFLNLMKQGTEQPSTVREKYATIVQKRRTVFREKIQRLREDYRQEEVKRRDQYLAEQKKKRDEFTAKRRESKESHQFFADQDKDRSRFFADERERRQSFESDLTAQNKDFESYMLQRSNDFNEQFRLYSKKFTDRPKDKKAVTGDSSSFKDMEKVPTSPLGTDQ